MDDINRQKEHLELQNLLVTILSDARYAQYNNSNFDNWNTLEWQDYAKRKGINSQAGVDKYYRDFRTEYANNVIAKWEELTKKFRKGLPRVNFNSNLLVQILKLNPNALRLYHKDTPEDATQNEFLTFIGRVNILRELLSYAYKYKYLSDAEIQARINLLRDMDVARIFNDTFEQVEKVDPELKDDYRFVWWWHVMNDQAEDLAAQIVGMAGSLQDIRDKAGKKREEDEE